MDNEIIPIVVPRKDKPPEIFKISMKSKKVIETFLETGDLEKARKENRVSKATAKDLILRPEIQTYIQNRYAYAAHKADLREDKVMAKINEIIDDGGKRDYPAGYLRALDLAAKVLKMVQPASVNINAQITANPYSELSDAELDNIMRERLTYAQEQSKPEKSGESGGIEATEGKA